MNSGDLIPFGFTSWQPFSAASERALLAALPKQFGVYVIRRNQQIGRFQGQSDIAYIGKATNKDGLQKRIYQYFHFGPTQTTNQRILRLVVNGTGFELSHVVCDTALAASDLESQLLTQYDAAHLELPPLNRQGA